MKKSAINVQIYLLFLISLLPTACAPPSEPLRRVSAARAPLIPEPEDDERAMAVLHEGDLVQLVRTLQPLAWKGTLEGEEATRSGRLIEVRRSPGEAGPTFGFESDLGEEVRVPAAAWLCKRMGGPPPCAERLRRVAMEGGVLAYDPCVLGTCRIGFARGGRVSWIAMEGLSDLWPATIDGRRVAVVTTRWVKSPSWTGATTYVLGVGDKIERLLRIETEEVDGTHPPAVHRMGTLAVEQGALTFRGTKRQIVPTTGEVLYTQPIVEVYHLK